MEYTLKNKKLTVVFESKGATLHSIKDNDGVEYLWEGNPEYWSGQDQFYFQFVEASEMIKHRLEIENRQTCQDMVS